MKWPSISDWLKRRQESDIDRIEREYAETIVGVADVQFPHCDTLILHSPGVCEFCDRHPDWQRLRIAERIAFSDTSEHDRIKQQLKPCPSTFRRPAHVRDQWYGNVPKASS